MTLFEQYQARLTDGRLRPDPAQEAVLRRLDNLQRDILRHKAAKPRNFLQRFLREKAEPAPRGMYLWGGVGRGKSMLMDLFFETLPITQKRRVHFHAFMQEIHKAMHLARQQGVEDALSPVAQNVIAQAKVLAFDEMQITDITDAMIVGRLFEKLLAAGVVIVTTSNRPPEDLYKDGLNRPLFLPFIAMIEKSFEVCALESLHDYRQHRLAGAQVYFLKHQNGAAELTQIWHQLTQDAPVAPLDLHVNGRIMTLKNYCNAVARAQFWDLCGAAMGPADYLAIAAAVRVLILDDIPLLSATNYNEAKRFVTLIDALYEAKVRLICSAADDPEHLYQEGRGAFEFERTASRLREMQGAYWGA